MEYYDFIRNNARVYWNDPGLNDYPQEERESRKRAIYTIFGLKDGEVIDDDTIINISDGTTEAEVYASELTPAYCDLTEKQRECIANLKNALQTCYDNNIVFIHDDYACELIPLDTTDVDDVLWHEDSNIADETTIELDRAVSEDFVSVDAYSLPVGDNNLWIRLKSRLAE